jgi:hypothetical protein
MRADRERAGALPDSLRTLVALAVLIICLSRETLCANEEAGPAVSFVRKPGAIAIRVAGRPFATYVFGDETITRPYFCNLHAPCGRLVTRPLPIEKGDLQDHPQMHPGLWLAFGDLSGEDYWRLNSPVQHVEFVEEPRGIAGRGTFALRNRYLAREDLRIVCEEVCRITILPDETTTTILWDSTFTPVGEPIVFGDQEEMGLGVRMAGGIAENAGKGGLLTNSEGATTAGEVWGQPAAWCDYSGEVDGRPVGITIAGHPQNVRPSWWHARDYGFMTANLFGREAMQQGPLSRIEVPLGESFRLRYAVIVHDGRPGGDYDPAAVIESLSDWSSRRGS